MARMTTKDSDEMMMRTTAKTATKTPDADDKDEDDDHDDDDDDSDDSVHRPSLSQWRQHSVDG